VALAANTITPRPPLNVFEVSRAQLSGNSANWVELAKVPRYYIPQNGPTAARFVNAAAIMTGLTVTNLEATSIRVSARIKGQDGAYYSVLNSAPVPPNDFLIISFDRQIMLTGESLEVVSADGAGTAHFTYIVNQREEFEVRNP
jgi:hypothetical protein